MRRGLPIVLLPVMLLAACGDASTKGTLDQGTIDVCISIVGFEIPTGHGLGPVDGWYAVAQAGVRVSRDSRVREASDAVLHTDTPDERRKGFSEPQREAYVRAIQQLYDACNKAGAFSGAYKHKAKQLYG